MTPADPQLSPPSRTTLNRRAPFTASWVAFAFLAAAVFIVARAIDHPVHNWCVGYFGGHAGLTRGTLPFVLRLPGNAWLLLPTVVLLLLILRKEAWRPLALMAAASVVAGTVAGIFKGLFGRARPDTWPGTPEWVWLRGGWHGFWHQTNVSFVSGDATQAFVWADALGLAVPALRWPAYALATVTCCQRVAVGAHWPSDVVGGAIVGVVTVRVLLRILSRVVPLAREGPDEEPAALLTPPD